MDGRQRLGFPRRSDVASIAIRSLGMLALGLGLGAVPSPQDGLFQVLPNDASLRLPWWRRAASLSSHKRTTFHSDKMTSTTEGQS